MPEAVAAFVVEMFALTGTAATVVNAAVQVAVIAGAGAVMKQNSEQKAQGQLVDLQLNSAAPRQLIVGKRMVGGVLVDWYLAGNNNTKLYMPTYLGEGPCGQITRVFAGGRQVWGTPLVHGVRTTIPDFRSGGDRLWLTYYDGRVGQTADATLVALGQGWTSDNKMTGCAYVVIECQWDSDNMRSPPQLSFEMEGAKLYDRRKDTTAGGSGAHRINSPATWEFSDNPMVALDHYMLGRYIGGVKTFGIGLSSDEVPYDRFAAQAAICDEDVALKAGGTQKRYRANGFMFANEDYSSVIAKLCVAMAARPADFGGRFGVIGIESRTPVMTIDDADMIAGVAEVYTPKRSWAELVGAIEGRFQDPAQLYQPVDYPRVTDAAWAAQDGGEPKVFTLDLEFETDVERAQRLATLRARAERRQAMLRGVYPLKTVELERGDWFIRTGPKWGAGKKFEVIERALDTDTWTVTIVSQEVDAADSAWNQATAQDGPPAPIASTDTLSTVSAPSLTVTSNPIAGAASSTPAIKIAFTNPTDPRVRHMFIEVYRTSDGLKVATETVGIPDADGVVIIQNGIADAVAHTVRARYLTVGLSSAWSTSYAVTTGAGYSVGTATAVPWTGVTSRPTNLSALGGTEPIQNALVAMGPNALRNAEYRITGGYYFTQGTSTAAPTAAYADSFGLRRASLTSTGSVPDAASVNLTGGANNRVPCVAGDRIEASAYLGATGWTHGGVNVYWYDAAGAFLSNSGAAASTSLSGKDGSGSVATFLRLGGFVTAPTNAVAFTIVCVFTNSSGAAITSPVGHITQPFARKADATQTALSPWAPGFEATLAADITSANTALGITGQGTLATISRANVVALAGTEAINNALVAMGPNGLRNAEYRITSGYYFTQGTSTPAPAATYATSSNLRRATLTSTGSVPAAASVNLTGGGNNQFPVQPGDRIEVSCYFGAVAAGWTHAQLNVFYQDAAGAFLANAVAQASTSLSGFDGSAGLSTFVRLGGFLTVPAGAFSCTITTVFLNSSGAAITSPVGHLTMPFLRKADATQTALSPWSPGFEATLAADITSANTALGITGQGALATLGQVNLGAAGRVYRDDGTTRLTDAIAVTSLGTAASIASQGDLATTNRASLPFGVNAATNSEFTISTSYPPFGYVAGGVGNMTGVTQVASIVTAGPRRAVKSIMSGTMGTGTYFDLFYSHYADAANARRYQLPVVDGDIVGASALVAKNSAVSAVYINIQWLDSTGNYVGENAGNSITANANGDTGQPTDYALSTVIATAPANARFANCYVRCLPVASAVNATGWAMSPMICRLQPGQTVVPAYTPGPVDRNADITSGNTAAAIAGQGWGATASQANADNAYNPIGENLLVNTDWAKDITGWYVSHSTNSGQTPVSGFCDTDSIGGTPGSFSGPIRVRYTYLPSTTASGLYVDGLCSKTYGSLADLKRYAVRVNGGDRMYASAYMSAHRGQAQLILVEFDDAGNPVGSALAWYGTANHGGAQNGQPANFERLGGFFTAQSTTRYVMLISRLMGTGGVNPYVFTGWPMIAKVSATQTVAPAYKSGQVDRYTDYTNENTAAAIINQGWGATASEAAARATRGRGLMKNACFEEYFTGTALPPQWNNWSNGTGTFVSKPFGDGSCFLQAGAAAAETGVTQTTTGIQPSTSYLLTGSVRRESGSLAGCGVYVEWYNSSDVYLATAQPIAFATSPTTAGLTNATPDGVHRWEKLVTSPAGAVKAVVYAMTHWSGHGSIAAANSVVWLEADLIPMSLVAQLRADVTSANTAGAITGQGSLATANYYYQSTDPGAVANGSQWADTTSKFLKIRDGGTWKNIGFFGELTATITGNYSASHSAAGTMTQTPSVTPSGGSGSYTYYWTVDDLIYGTTPTLNNRTSATVTVTKTFGNTLSISGVLNCLITDTVTGRVTNKKWGYEDLATASGDGSGGLPP